MDKMRAVILWHWLLTAIIAAFLALVTRLAGLRLRWDGMAGV
jgi:hypothetical protein